MFVHPAFIIGTLLIVVILVLNIISLKIEAATTRTVSKKCDTDYHKLKASYERQQQHHDSVVMGLMKDNEALLKERCTLRRQLPAKALPQWPHSIKPSL